MRNRTIPWIRQPDDRRPVTALEGGLFAGLIACLIVLILETLCANLGGKFTAYSVAILSTVCVALTLAASVHDIIARTIPNRLVSVLAIVGLADAVAVGHVAGSLLAAGGVFIAAILCWQRGFLGGGDVKLLAAASLAVPPSAVPLFIGAVAISGGLLAILYLVARPLVAAPAAGRPNSLLGRAARAERRRVSRGGALPYACAITGGFMFVII
jgi:prepilin peptidase CpaA